MAKFFCSPQVVEEIAHAGADKLRKYGPISPNYRQEHILIEVVVEIVDAHVHAAPGVIDIRGTGEVLTQQAVRPR